MRRRHCLGIASVVLLSWFVLATVIAATGSQETPAAAAAKASPELVGALSKELGATPDQAAGAAGALFNVAKSKLSADQFEQVAKAVPGMSSLLKAAPDAGGGVAGTTGAISQATGTAAGLAGAASSFSKLGLKPEMVSKAVPVLTSFVSKSGGADVGQILAGALK
jgi:hypothetical protein